MVEQAVDYGELEKSIRAVTLKFGLEDVDGNKPLDVILFHSSLTSIIVVERKFLIVIDSYNACLNCYR